MESNLQLRPQYTLCPFIYSEFRASHSVVAQGSGEPVMKRAREYIVLISKHTRAVRFKCPPHKARALLFPLPLNYLLPRPPFGFFTLLPAFVFRLGLPSPIFSARLAFCLSLSNLRSAFD